MLAIIPPAATPNWDSTRCRSRTVPDLEHPQGDWWEEAAFTDPLHRVRERWDAVRQT